MTQRRAGLKYGPPFRRVMKVRNTILCIDPGFRNCGFAIWDCTLRTFRYSLVLSFPPSDDKYVVTESVRVVRSIALRMRTIIEDYNPRFVVAEMPTSGGRSARASTCMALASATIISTCAVLGVKLCTIRPQEIKRLVSGRGNIAVPKKQVIAYIQKRFGSTCLPRKAGVIEHVADAMAAFAVWEDIYERR